MFDTLRSLVEAGVGAIPSERAEKLARSLLDRGEELASRVAGEVRKQMRTAGIVTREELSELKKRVRQLEREAAQNGAGPAKASAKQASARKATNSRAAGSAKTAAKRGDARRPGP